ncbi:hypothetical protein HDV00_004830 [Rhizophlyctis rosea]|nr:hypothetical protein HDV00_004830 [Rhizophlyctis rosea]
MDVYVLERLKTGSLKVENFLQYYGLLGAQDGLQLGQRALSQALRTVAKENPGLKQKATSFDGRLKSVFRHPHLVAKHKKKQLNNLRNVNLLDKKITKAQLTSLATRVAATTSKSILPAAGDILEDTVRQVAQKSKYLFREESDEEGDGGEVERGKKKRRMDVGFEMGMDLRFGGGSAGDGSEEEGQVHADETDERTDDEGDDDSDDDSCGSDSNSTDSLTTRTSSTSSPHMPTPALQPSIWPPHTLPSGSYLPSLMTTYLSSEISTTDGVVRSDILDVSDTSLLIRHGILTLEDAVFIRREEEKRVACSMDVGGRVAAYLDEFRELESPAEWRFRLEEGFLHKPTRRINQDSQLRGLVKRLTQKGRVGRKKARREAKAFLKGGEGEGEEEEGEVYDPGNEEHRQLRYVRDLLLKLWWNENIDGHNILPLLPRTSQPTNHDLFIFLSEIPRPKTGRIARREG